MAETLTDILHVFGFAVFAFGVLSFFAAMYNMIRDKFDDAMIWTLSMLFFAPAGAFIMCLKVVQI